MGLRLCRFSLWAGYLSYPVYLLQAPLLWAFAPLTVRLSSVVLAPAMREAAAQLYPCLVILVSWLIARRFDSPVRDWLSRRFLHRPAVLAAQSAP
jgi:peptidoglycan/LPS O-acetylase OafA/YrhL